MLCEGVAARAEELFVLQGSSLRASDWRTNLSGAFAGGGDGGVVAAAAASVCKLLERPVLLSCVRELARGGGCREPLGFSCVRAW